MESPAIRSHCLCQSTTHSNATQAIPLLSGLVGMVSMKYTKSKILYDEKEESKTGFKEKNHLPINQSTNAPDTRRQNSTLSHHFLSLYEAKNA